MTTTSGVHTQRVFQSSCSKRLFHFIDLVFEGSSHPLADALLHFRQKLCGKCTHNCVQRFLLRRQLHCCRSFLIIKTRRCESNKTLTVPRSSRLVHHASPRSSFSSEFARCCYPANANGFIGTKHRHQVGFIEVHIGIRRRREVRERPTVCCSL